ncbi:MAG: tetratricopeptide repeat protein [Pseudomarimonas sp.]
MKHDDAEYAFLEFETELDNNAANTHIGMYLAWAVLNRLVPESKWEGSTWDVALNEVRERRKTGGEFLSDQCDCKLMSDDLNEEGNAFTLSYYGRQFVADYEAVFAQQIPDTGHPTDDLCCVPDTWENFDLLRPLLDRRFAEWKAGTGSSSLPDATAASIKQPLTLEPLAPVGLSGLATEPPRDAEPAPVVPTAEKRATVAELRKRADGGDREAMYALAIEYLTGESIPQDYAQAAAQLEKAAQLGLVEAQYNLGVCFQRGDGKPKSIEQAMRWWGMAAEAGHAEALYMLGMCYRAGDGVAKDFIASNALMLMAKARGSRDAQRAGVMAGSFAASMLLAEKLRLPGQLIAQLSARRLALRAGTVDDGLALWRDAANADSPKDPNAVAGPRVESLATANAGRAASSGRTHQPTAQSESAHSSERHAAPAKPIGLHHLALAIGSFAFILLLLLAGTLVGTPLKLAAVALAVIGAWGSYATCHELEVSPVMRFVFTALSLVPVAGSFACIAVLLRWVRSRSGEA